MMTEVRHATEPTLDQLEPLLVELRALEGLREKKRGTFYRGSSAFLHFHEDPAGTFADVKLDGEFQRFRATSERERRALVARVQKALKASARSARAARRSRA
jgi:hypothetical protein